MEQIGGNNRGIISYVIVVGVFFFFQPFSFPYFSIIPCCSIYFFNYQISVSRSEFFFFTMKINRRLYFCIPITHTYVQIRRFRFNSVKWFRIDSKSRSVFDSLDFFLIRSFAIGVCLPNEEKRLWLIVAFSFWWELMIAMNWLLEATM